MKVLVLGGSGFIGSHLIDALLKHDYDVVNVDLKLDEKVQTLQTDVTNMENVTAAFRIVKPEIVFNMVCYGFEQSEQNPAKAALVNSVATFNVLKASLKHKVKKMVHSSTGTVYGEPEYLSIDENHPAKPLCVYGVTKLAAEHFCTMMKSRGLKVTILRYSNVLGKNRNFGVIHTFKNRILKNQPPIIFGGSQSNDYVHVEDVVKANLACLNKGDNEVFNIGSGSDVSITELANIMLNHFESDLKLVYKQARPYDPQWRFCYDVSKARKVLGWKPQYRFGEILKLIL